LQGALIAVAAALAGCNQIYGLENTRPRDADVAVDAPYSCPEPGPPQFRGTPVNVITGLGLIRYYSFALDRSRATAVQLMDLVEGAVDSPDMRPATLEPAIANVTVARLSPEGDELFVRRTLASPMFAIDRYARMGDRWVRAARVLTFDGAGNPEMSIPTARGAAPRRMLVKTASDVLVEYEEVAPDQWSPVGAPITAADLDATTIDEPNLSPDGRVLVFRGQVEFSSTLLYSRRTSLAVPFGAAVVANPFFGSPVLVDPAIVDDCSRLYFLITSGTGSENGVYYVEPD
jgi:hypothetical protein